MKNLAFYQENLNCNSSDDVFKYFISSLKPRLLTFDYFVNWEKVFKNTKEIEIGLNSLNYLIGKQNFDEEFKFLLKQNPSLIKILPLLLVRDGSSTKKFEILKDYSNNKLIYEGYDFTLTKPLPSDIEKYLYFVEMAGLKTLIKSQKIKNLVDYMLGVEAGLDSNGRKNRGGKIMEKVTESFINDFCRKNNFEYLTDANSKKIYENWKVKIPVDKSSRRYDFVVKTKKELIIFETNFYGGGGSKLKSTAGEYRNLYDVLKDEFKFVWITDGYGWRATSRPLRETFDHNDYIFNLDMLEKNILNSIV
ncbi:type II restriction endonuclease [Methylophilaceae bacterium]|nr:type II restriction endonuclease [Methylophilaceae bacterium]